MAAWLHIEGHNCGCTTTVASVNLLHLQTHTCCKLVATLCQFCALYLFPCSWLSVYEFRCLSVSHLTGLVKKLWFEFHRFL